MRALLRSALLVTAASAQDGRLRPAPPEQAEPLALGGRCEGTVAMPELFPDAPGAAVSKMPLGEARPAPMPNLCDGPAPLAVCGKREVDLSVPFGRRPTRRFQLAPDATRRFRESSPDVLRLPPVAPPGEHE